jgi:hypothetical protein
MREVEGFSRLYEISLTLILAIWFLSGQLAIVAIWKIVRFFERSEFFTLAALNWVNRVVLLCWLAVAGSGAIFIVTIPRAEDPGIFVLITAIGLFLFSLALFATLLRDQIRNQI